MRPFCRVPLQSDYATPEYLNVLNCFKQGSQRRLRVHSLQETYAKEQLPQLTDCLQTFNVVASLKSAQKAAAVQMLFSLSPSVGKLPSSCLQ